MVKLLRKILAAPQPMAAHAVYIASVERSRNPFFYDALHVPDTLDGRFEMIVLHLFLLQDRLAGNATEFARTLSELFFADMDRSVRELGVADTGVRYRIKAMAKAYNGRMQAYATTIDDAQALMGALARNLYGTVADGTVETLEAMARYARSMRTALAAMDEGVLQSDAFRWPEISKE